MRIQAIYCLVSHFDKKKFYYLRDNYNGSDGICCELDHHDIEKSKVRKYKEVQDSYKENGYFNHHSYKVQEFLEVQLYEMNAIEETVYEMNMKLGDDCIVKDLEKPKKYECLYCDKTYNDMPQLRYHVPYCEKYLEHVKQFEV